MIPGFWYLIRDTIFFHCIYTAKKHKFAQGDAKSGGAIFSTRREWQKWRIMTAISVTANPYDSSDLVDVVFVERKVGEMVRAGVLNRADGLLGVVVRDQPLIGVGRQRQPQQTDLFLQGV